MNPLTFLMLALATLLSVNGAHAAEEASIIEAAATVEKLADGMKFTEGPVWLPTARKLVFSDIPSSKLMQWSEASGLSVYRNSDSANGNILDLQGRIISCQHGARNVIRIEEDGSTTVLADQFEGKRFNSPNDVAIRSDGTLWFTDPPWGLNEPHEIPGHWVYKVDPETGVVEVVHKHLAMPNGIVFSPDETRIYIADTGGNKRHPDPKFHDFPASIQCYAVSRDGKLGNQLFQIDSGSDGMAVDSVGNLYTTNGGQVRVYAADGSALAQIDVPEAPANVCFGGDDRKTLFITARTSLYSIRLQHAGVKPTEAN